MVSDLEDDIAVNGLNLMIGTTENQIMHIASEWISTLQMKAQCREGE